MAVQNNANIGFEFEKRYQQLVEEGEFYIQIKCVN